MVTVQQAFQRAVEYAREMLGNLEFTLEEVERGDYRNQDVWLITLGFPKRGSIQPDKVLGSIAQFTGVSGPREYKTFFINASTGEPMAMKFRELAI